MPLEKTPVMRKKNISRVRQNNVFVFTVFFLSGTFALIYEVSWVRAITLEFGSTTLAVSTVLAIFMGGLALGAGLVRHRVDTFADPLTKYGILELAIGSYALLTPLLFQWLLPLFATLGAAYAENIWFITGLRFVACGLLLLLPTVMMGATLPVLVRFYADHNDDGARGGGLLYGINTVGAFVGTLSAGFLLLPRLGLFWTLICVATCNIILGMVAYRFGRGLEGERESVHHAGLHVASERGGRPAGVAADTPMLFAIALTGFAAMACEVLWTRVLILVIGGSVYAFATVLFTFLAGLGMGAAVIAAFLRADAKKAVTVFYLLALATALVVAVSARLLQGLPALFLNLFWSWELIANPDLIIYQQILICALVMFIPALLMGGLFPVALRIVVQTRRSAGRVVARLYFWNTIGSIAGSVAAGFLLIPLLGIRIGLIIIVCSYCIAAIVVISVRKGKSFRTGALFAPAGIALALSLLVPPWQEQLMTSAMYNYAYHLKTMDTQALARTLRDRHQVLYYKDGLSATVTVTRSKSSQNLGITVNGKYDGSSSRDMANQRLLAHVPLLFHRDPKEVCVIGMGTGCTAGSAALHPVNSVDVVEIESAVVEGARFFREDNHAVHDNEKVNIHVTDGRLFLRLHTGSFDVIISEPSNPWLAGSSDLFTVDFFESAAKALRRDGFFCQWVQLYGLSPANLQTVVRTFTHVFPNTYVISTRPNIDMLLLGSKQPFQPDLQQADQRLRQQAIRADLADPRIEIMNVFDLAARFRMGPKEMHALSGVGPLHTDDLPVVAYRAPRDLYVRTEERNMQLLAAQATGIAPYMKEMPMSTLEKEAFLGHLATAYRRFLPTGKEVQVCLQMLRQLSNGLDSE
jgi:spermidine synthase